MTDCIIVGGGVIGMMCARELAERGMAVTLLEQGGVGRESSWAGGGIVSPLHPWRASDAITTLIRWSQARYPLLAEELKEETGIDPEWTRSGFLLLEGEREEALAWAATHGFNLRALDDGDELAIEPALRTPRGGALWLPDVAQVRNPRLLGALRSSLLKRGVAVHEHTPATGFMIRQGRIEGVRTATAEWRAERVVVAAGAWTGGLLEPLGTPLAIEPVRGQMLLFKGPPGLLGRIVMREPHYLIPRRDGRILAGSTVERVGFDKSTTASAREELRQAARDLVPALAECPIEQHWAGLRPGSHEGMPSIGEHPDVRGLYVNAGHYRNGLGLAPASASLLVNLLLVQEPIVDPGPFQIRSH